MGERSGEQSVEDLTSGSLLCGVIQSMGEGGVRELVWAAPGPWKLNAN